MTLVQDANPLLRHLDTFTITNRAAARLRALAAGSNQPDGGVRIGVKVGGCTRFTYTVEYAAEPAGAEVPVEKSGVILLIAPRTAPFLEETEMDYVERDGGGGGFTFTPVSR